MLQSLTQFAADSGQFAVAEQAAAAEAAELLAGPDLAAVGVAVAESAHDCRLHVLVGH